MAEASHLLIQTHNAIEVYLSMHLVYLVSLTIFTSMYLMISLMFIAKLYKRIYSLGDCVKKDIMLGATFIVGAFAGIILPLYLHISILNNIIVSNNFVVDTIILVLVFIPSIVYLIFGNHPFVQR